MSRPLSALNDQFRTTLTGGRVVVTPGVAARGLAFEVAALAAVQAFGTFDADNDPHGSHDFGVVKVAEQKLFWKIDAYADEDMRFGAEDPASPETVRVLTIMLPLEY